MHSGIPAQDPLGLLHPLRTTVVTITYLLISVSVVPALVAEETKEQMLVIAPRKLQSGVERFVQAKQKFLSTRLVPLEEVLEASEGVDDPEKLKRYLYKEWRGDGLGYALLV